jgi:hypothetical protein
VNTSGLIYAAIVVVWGVVLVPMWLRRHDEVTESRSVDRFQGAMRTLSRRDSGGAGDRREVLVPRRARTKTVPDGATVPTSPASIAAARRRRVGLVLIALMLIVLVLGVVHVVPIWAPALPVLLLAFFVLRARASARRVRVRELSERRARASESRRLRHEQAARAMGRTGARAAPARTAQTARTAEPAPLRAPMVEAGRSEASAPRPQVAAQAVVPAPAARFYDAVAERAWDPVPVPLPTYVSAPKAPRSVRIIDLTLPGAWTSGRLEGGTAAAATESAAGSEAAREAAERDPIVTGEVLVERRAVGD